MNANTIYQTIINPDFRKKTEIKKIEDASERAKRTGVRKMWVGEGYSKAFFSSLSIKAQELIQECLNGANILTEAELRAKLTEINTLINTIKGTYENIETNA